MVHWNQKNKPAMKINPFHILLATLLLASAAMQAQIVELEKMQQFFPDKLAVFSNVNRSVEITMKEGAPFIEENEVSEMMVLN